MGQNQKTNLPSMQNQEDKLSSEVLLWLNSLSGNILDKQVYFDIEINNKKKIQQTLATEAKEFVEQGKLRNIMNEDKETPKSVFYLFLALKDLFPAYICSNFTFNQMLNEQKIKYVINKVEQYFNLKIDVNLILNEDINVLSKVFDLMHKQKINKRNEFEDKNLIFDGKIKNKFNFKNEEVKNEFEDKNLIFDEKINKVILEKVKKNEEVKNLVDEKINRINCKFDKSKSINVEKVEKTEKIKNLNFTKLKYSDSSLNTINSQNTNISELQDEYDRLRDQLRAKNYKILSLQKNLERIVENNLPSFERYKVNDIEEVISILNKEWKKQIEKNIKLEIKYNSIIDKYDRLHKEYSKVLEAKKNNRIWCFKDC